MKAIILAAGEGKRMRPLTLTTPKPMIPVLGKPLLHHIVDSLPKEITTVIFVVGYKGDQIRGYFGKTFEGREIIYVEQNEPLGTGHALELCRPHIREGERFFFMIGDDLHSPKALENLLKYPFAMLVHEHKNPERFGVVEVDKNNVVVGFEEKPLAPKSNLVSPAVFVLDDRIFKYPKVKHRTGEFFAVDQINQMMKDIPLIAEKSDFWFPVGYPEDIDALEFFLEKKNGISKKKNQTPVIIIAGGKGTRMPEGEKEKPKALVEIAGKPMLHWQIEEVRRQGFENIILSLGYKAEMAVEWLKKSGNSHIQYSIEKEPLGTGGGLKLAAKGINEPFLAFNADDLADVNFHGLIRHGNGGVFNVLAGAEIADARAFGLLKCDEHKKICAFQEKNPSSSEGGLVSIGHYYLTPDIFDGTPEAFSIENDVFTKLAAEGKLVIFKHTGYWLPTGTAEQLQITREYFSKSH